MAQTAPPPTLQAEERAWHARSLADTVQELTTDPERGLTESEARSRLQQYGRNRLEEGKRRTWAQMLGDQFKDVTIWVLLAAVVVAVVMGDVTDALVILAIVFLNTILSVVQESKAEQSLAALKELASPHARVLRDGRPADVPSEELVPGDLVMLEAGSYVPADLRLVETANLRLEEASLTGESVPVEKAAEAVLEPETPIGDRVNVAFSGTTVAHGRGRGVVVATGAGTEIGHIATLLGGIDEGQTPLQQRLAGLGRWIAGAVLVICGIVFVAALLRGLPLSETLLTAVSLAVAAIPEGLPAVVTVVLALGMTNMVRRHVIVRRLRAVESLGTTTVICTDKTGTLTQNEMTVRRFNAGGRSGTVTGTGYSPGGEFSYGEGKVDPPGDRALWRLLRIGALCNDAILVETDGEWDVTGDPTEGALLVAAAKGGLSMEELREERPRRRELPFDSDRKRMSTLHELPEGGYRLAVKGAPDEILRLSVCLSLGEETRPLTDEDRGSLEAVNREFAEGALRVLGFAYRDFPSVPEEFTPETIERELVFAGLIGMIDPPRPEAKEAVRLCRKAGIRPVMITGDYPVTARAIADELELTGTASEVVTGAEVGKLSDLELRERSARISVYARVSPADKLRIVEAYQAAGNVVAMTGDGVNDAPALKRADIGVAMGKAGTDVAKGAADIVLTDDNFASIVAAVEEGRGIFDNIRKFVFYLLSCNISEVLTLFIAIVAGLPQPLMAVQILWVNLVTDGLPALALGVEPKEPGIMERPPRDPREGVLNRETTLDILWYGLFITLATLAAYLHGLYWFCLVPAGQIGFDGFWAAFRPGFWNDPALQRGLTEARTLAFGTLAFSQLAHSLNSRSETYSLFQLKPWTNPQLLGAIALSVVLQLGVIYLPAANHIFETAPIGGTSVLVGTALSVSPLFFGEIRKAWKRRKGGVAVSAG